MLSKRVFLRPSITGAIALAAALTALPAQAQRMSFDGPWSVLILGDQGSCQGQAYRYGVQIASGQVFSRSSEADIFGRVTPRGQVQCPPSPRQSGSSRQRAPHTRFRQRILERRLAGTAVRRTLDRGAARPLLKA